MGSNVLTDTKFESFSLNEVIQKGLTEAGYSHCTPIQEKALPITLDGRDVAGQAQTGTGKTATFLIATFQYLLSNPPATPHNQPRALIIAPTRELAIQIASDAQSLGKFTSFKVSLVYGGTGYRQQIADLEQGTDILIGTPGRLIDFYKQKIYHLNRTQVVVLDEADRMFDLGFIKDIRFVLRKLPNAKNRLSLLFSATLSYRVLELAYEHMNNPELIRIEPEQITAKSVSQYAYYPANEQKVALLIGLLREKTPTRSIVFVNTKRTAEQVKAFLRANEFDTGVLSGDVPQQKRQSLLKSFQDNELPILIATDVAARGLHIDDVSHVINFDLPQDVEDYVHRIGRTARLGASGEAISLVCEEYVYSLPDIESYLGHKLPMESITETLLPQIVKPKQRTRGRNTPSGNRSSKSTHFNRKKRPSPRKVSS